MRCCFLPVGSDDSEDKVYDSYQALLMNQITAATLFMGFTLTGALISLSFSGDEDYSAVIVAKFVNYSFEAFKFCTASFAIAFMISSLGAMIKGGVACGTNATRFFRMFAWLICLSEMFLYLCADDLLYSMEYYVKMNYEAPVGTLCVDAPTYPKNPMEKAEAKLLNTTIGANGNRANTPCAQTGSGLYDTAAKVCASSPPAGVESRFFNMACKQFTEYTKAHIADSSDLKNAYFGYRSEFNDDLENGLLAGDPFNEAYIVENNAKIFGEAGCGVTDACSASTELCKQAKTTTSTSLKASCASAVNACNNAQSCAGSTTQDLLKCFQTCAHSKGEAKYATMFSVFHFLEKGIKVWMVVRVVAFLVMLVWDLRASANPANFAPQGQDYDDLESE